MKTSLKNLRRTAAVIIGLTFFVSGVLKLADPVGTGLIVEGYLGFFHLGFLKGAALVFGVILSLAEGVLGAALVMGVAKKISGWAAIGFTAFFTLISIILLAANPDMECGCFGKAIPLTHFQTFIKNVILVILCAVAFIPPGGEAPRKGRVVAFFLEVAGLITVLVYSSLRLPSIDFTEFAPGTELLASSDNDYQAEDGLLPVCIYEKNGQTGSFVESRLPDSTWTFVRNDTIARNNIPLPEDFAILSFYDEFGDYQDELAVLGKVMVVSVPAPDKLRQKEWETLSKFVDKVLSSGVNPLVLTSDASCSAIPATVRPYVFTSDRRTLLSLNRSNGGATYFDDGMLVRKYSFYALPGKKKIAKISEKDPTDSAITSVSRGRIRAHGYLLYALAIMILP